MSQDETEDAKESDSLDLKIAQALIEDPMRTDVQLAKMLKASRRTISRRKCAKPVREIVKQAFAIPVYEVRRLVNKSLNRIESHLDSENPRISLAAAIHLTKLGEKAIEQDLIEDSDLEFVYE
jgi:hypothetical protein